ncbi:hypothetical protein NBRC116493_26600 [Aurantivibrio infirmus]
MAIYLRQICLVAEKLAPAIDELSAIFSIPNCYVDPAVNKFGLGNTLLLIGSQFIEVVAPLENNSPLESTAAGRFLKRRAGDGGYMVICQVPTLQEQRAIRARALDNNVRVAYESDRETWNIMQLHPADMGAAFFEVDWDKEADMQGSWHPAGGLGWQGKVSTEVVNKISAIELQSDDPDKLALHWAAVAGLHVEYKNEIPIVPLANVELRFVKANDGRGAGLGALDLQVVDKQRLLKQAEARGVMIKENQLMICGTRFNLVD